MFNTRKITLKKLTEYGLYLLVFLLPLQTRWIIRPGELNGGYFEYGTISLYATDIILLAVLLLFIIDFLKNKKILNHRSSEYKPKSQITPQRKCPWGINPLVIFACLELTVFISCCFADNKLIAFYKYAWFLLGIGFFFLIVKANYSRLKLMFNFFLGVFASASLGIWQFLNQSSFANKWLGLAAHDPSVPGASVVEAIGNLGLGERWLRAYGTLDHPNILGGLLTLGAIIVILTVLCLKETEGKETVAGYKYIILTYYLLFITSLFALFFTFSRAAWLAFVVGLFIILIIALIKKDRFGQIQILKIILVSSVLFFILFTSFQNLVLVRVKGGSRLEQKSNIERLDSNKAAVDIFKDNWLIGVGMGNYTTELAKINPSHPAYFYQPTHNAYLLIAAEIGIFGIALFLYLILYISYSILKSEKIYKTPLIIALIILLTFDHWLWSLHFGVLFLFFALGFVFIGDKKLE
ncbi:O-antigen ligase family protein [Candidatus Parcubacteria bacterium]|nr:O-antigen ligase family protein [Candidatus Parcubacteria bacterium]